MPEATELVVEADYLLWLICQSLECKHFEDGACNSEEAQNKCMVKLPKYALEIRSISSVEQNANALRVELDKLVTRIVATEEEREVHFNIMGAVVLLADIKKEEANEHS